MGVYAPRVRRRQYLTLPSEATLLHTEAIPETGPITIQLTRGSRPGTPIFQNYTEDELHPGWKTKILHGESVFGSFYKNETELRVYPTVGSGSKSSGNIDFVPERVRFDWDLCEWTAMMSESSAYGDIEGYVNALRVLAGTKCMARVKSEEIQLLATIGESKETIHMLTSACKTLLKLNKALRVYAKTLVRAARAKKRSLIKKLYLDAENCWMQVRMGWRPFAGEVGNLYAACNNHREQRWRSRFTAKALGSKSASTTYYNNRNNGIGVNCTIASSIGCEFSVRAGCIAEARDGGFPDTFGLTKIPQTIWELTTLSWAVDYFFNIGDAIAAHIPDPYWKPLVTWTTVNRSYEAINLVRNATYGYYGPPVSNGYRWFQTRRRLRQPGVAVGFQLDPDISLGPLKTLDIVAVARQKLNATLNLLKGKKGARW